jgi:hypothetical protein
MALALLSLLPASANAYFAHGVGPAFNALIGTHAGHPFHSPHLAFHTTRLTVFPTIGVPWGGYSPLLGYPYLGAYGPYGVYGMSQWVLPPVVVAPVPNDIAVPKELPPPAARPAPRGEAAGRFRPVEPLDRDRAREPIRADLPPPRPVTPPFAQPPLDHGDLLQSGRRAFAAGEYGRAAEMFRQALATAPPNSNSPFLLAQCQFALGKYADAVATIHQVLAQTPEWPATGSPFRELYAGDAQAFADHLQRLEDAAASRAGDPALNFLRAYVRWFDSRRSEARVLFRQVRERVAKPEAIDRFLQVPAG